MAAKTYGVSFRNDDKEYGYSNLMLAWEVVEEYGFCTYQDLAGLEQGQEVVFTFDDEYHTAHVVLE